MKHANVATESAGTVDSDRPLPGDDRKRITHPVDIRIRLPLPFGRYYLSLFAGPERRAAELRHADRDAEPIGRLNNFALYFATAMAVNALAVVGVLIYTSVLRF